MKSFAIWYTNKDKIDDSYQDKSKDNSYKETKKYNDPEIELHFNLWKVKNKKFKNRVSDIGDSILDIGIKVKVIENMSEINMFIPFHFDEIEDLGIKMKDNRKVINGIFNDDCEIKKSGNSKSTIIERNGGIDSSKKEIRDIIKIFTLDVEYQKNFCIEKKEEGTIVTINVEDDYSEGNEKNYYRFRIKGNDVLKNFEKVIKSKDRLFTSSTVVSYIIDFRLNEKRSLPENLNMLLQKSDRLSITKIHFLLLMDICYKLGDTGLDYSMRSLEDDLWDEYLGNQYTTKNLVGYHWKESKRENESTISNFNSYIRIEESKSNKTIIFLYLIGIIILGLITSLIHEIFVEFGFLKFALYFIFLILWISIFELYHRFYK